MKKIKSRLLLLLFVFALGQKAYAISLWVGESYTCDATSSVMGLTYNTSWSTSGGYISLSGSGLYRDVKVTQYFSGEATVTCSWQYKLYPGDKMHDQKRTWKISCRENPVSISPTTLTLSPGSTGTVWYSHKYSNNYVYAANAYFQSTNPSVATVSNDGTVRAISEGTTYINVYSKISSGAPYCIVTVKKVRPTSVSLPASITIIEGDTKTLTPTITPSGAKTDFTWMSDDESIAKVNSNGTVMGIAPGTTRIHVTTTEGNCSDYCNVIVKKAPVAPTSISLPQELKLYRSYSATLTPTLVPSDAETTYQWTSDDTSVVTVSSAGVVTGKKEGLATVTVKTKNNLSASVKIYVTEAPIESDNLSKTIGTINKLLDKTIKVIE